MRLAGRGAGALLDAGRRLFSHKRATAGTSRAKTPATAQRRSPTLRRALGKASPSHALRATKDGYQPLQKNFEVDSDVQEVPFVLEKAAGSLLIRTQPDGATISADGTVLASTTPTTSRLPMGRHRITLTKEGFAPYTFEATVDDLLPHSTSLTLAPAH